MSAVFGPVASRRLGKSLGIDPIPLKTCNWNCVYCQLGRSRPMTNTRQEYISCQEIFVEVEQALASHLPGEIDWVTFVGSGEPTLHSKLGWLISQVKALTDLPVAVITNGALLCQPEVRAELAEADAVIPTLDAGNAYLYRLVNRPWPELTFDSHLAGLKAFRQEFEGQLWIEAMLIEDLNDSPQALHELADVLAEIGPDQVQITLPVRPPAEAWVRPAKAQVLQGAQQILGGTCHIYNAEQGPFLLNQRQDLPTSLLNLITRHPMSESVLIAGLSAWKPQEVRAALADLQAQGAAQQVQRHNGLFWSAAGSYYAGEGKH